MVTNTAYLFRRLLRTLHIDVVCDVGSMDGSDARRFRHALPSAAIFAFEAHPGNFRRMESSPTLQGTRIELVPLAVTDHDGEARFFLVGDGYTPGNYWRGMSSLLRREHHPELLTEISVSATRLDSFLAGKLGPNQRVALWIDTEGKAFEVLLGSSGLLRQVQLLHIEVETTSCIGRDSRLFPEVNRLLTSAGFRQLATDQSPKRVQFNSLYLRADLLSAQRRITIWHLWIARMLWLVSAPVTHLWQIPLNHGRRYAARLRANVARAMGVIARDS